MWGANQPTLTRSSSGSPAVNNTQSVSGLLIGYARVTTDEQDLTAQRDALTALGVAPERIYVDHGLSGTNRARPGLREAWPRAGATMSWS